MNFAERRLGIVVEQKSGHTPLNWLVKLDVLGLEAVELVKKSLYMTDEECNEEAIKIIETARNNFLNRSEAQTRSIGEYIDRLKIKLLEEDLAIIMRQPYETRHFLASMNAELTG